MGQDLLAAKKKNTEHRPYRIEGFLIVLTGSLLFYYIALFSFNPFDSSWFAASRPAHPPTNSGGIVGAHLSSIFIYYFGLSALVLPLPFLFYIIVKLFDARPFTPYAFALGGVCFFLGTNFLFGEYIPIVMIYDLPFAGGGSMGMQLQHLVETWFGFKGGHVVVFTLLLLGLCLMFKLSSIHDLIVALISKVFRPTFSKLKFWRFLPTFDRPLAPASVSNVANSAGPIVGLSQNEPRVYIAPQTHLHSHLFQQSNGEKAVDASKIAETQKALLNALSDFKISGTMLEEQVGPLVTTFAFKPEKGVKQASIANLINDIALALKVESLFIHPIPEKGAIGFQIPNGDREVVRFADLVHSKSFQESPAVLPLAIGKNVYGAPVCEDLTQMPHLLIAGSTGSGKSVGIHSFICSLLLKVPSSQLKLILIDPKMLELTYYEGLPQLLMPVITDPSQAFAALQDAIAEMERRYRLMQVAKVRNIDDFNDFWQKASPQDKVNLGKEQGVGEVGLLPYHVIVIDELADLMMTAPKDMEQLIARLAQKARASGIHMILATQRPSVDVITGTIKANLPSRITYRLVSSHDSRTIIDQIGAEKLLGKGDLLFQRPGASRLIRLHGAFIHDHEIKALVNHLKGAIATRGRH